MVELSPSDELIGELSSSIEMVDGKLSILYKHVGKMRKGMALWSDKVEQVKKMQSNASNETKHVVETLLKQAEGYKKFFSDAINADVSAIDELKTSVTALQKVKEEFTHSITVEESAAQIRLFNEITYTQEALSDIAGGDDEKDKAAAINLPDIEHQAKRLIAKTKALLELRQEDAQLSV